jgi:hypothetical protein
MTLEEYKNRYIEQSVDVDEAYGAQCYDLVVSYWKEVYGLFEQGNPICQWTGGVVDFFHYFSKMFDENIFELVVNNPNDTTQIPPSGAVYILNEGYLGHTGIVYTSNETNFISLDQNWGSGVDGSGSGEKRIRMVVHDYNKMLGWITVKNESVLAQSSLASITEGQIPPISQSKEWESQMQEKDEEIAMLKAKIEYLNSKIPNIASGSTFLD